MLEDDLQALAARPRRGRNENQDADTVARAAPNPPAKLVQLREAEALGLSITISKAFGTSTPTSITVVRDQHLRLARRERGHRRRLLRRRQPAVQQADVQVRQLAGSVS